MSLTSTFVCGGWSEHPFWKGKLGGSLPTLLSTFQWDVEEVKPLTDSKVVTLWCPAEPGGGWQLFFLEAKTLESFAMSLHYTQWYKGQITFIFAVKIQTEILMPLRSLKDFYCFYYTSVFCQGGICRQCLEIWTPLVQNTHLMWISGGFWCLAWSFTEVLVEVFRA